MKTLNAASAEFTIKGVNVHPGEAKDIMVKCCFGWLRDCRSAACKRDSCHN